VTPGRTAGIPLVLAAPSGTGKTTVCRKLIEADPNLVFSVSHTTRPRRSGEEDGVAYHFVSGAEFQRLIDADAFLEWAVYDGSQYGTSWRAIETELSEGRDLLLEIEVQGARQVRERRRDARLIFLTPPSDGELERRLTGRGTDSAEQVRRRLDLARQEIRAIGGFDYAVVNDDLERCVAEVAEIIAAERRGDAGALRRRFDPREAGRRLGIEADD
jgi:guanylate kinase